MVSINRLIKMDGTRQLVTMGDKIYHVILHVLERTNGSVIFRGIAENDDTPYVYKVVPAELTTDLENEYLILRKLYASCPPDTVITTYGLGMVSSNCCIKMEHMHMDLYTWLMNNDHELDVLLDAFVTLVDLVDSVHRANYIHGDLKMENVLVDADSCIMKLCDFNDACEFSVGSTRTVYFRGGTPPYLPYEALIENSIKEFLLPKVDAYALGIILYVMLTKTFLWKSQDRYGILDEMTSDLKEDRLASKIDPRWPSDVVEVLHGLLENDARQRLSVSMIKGMLGYSDDLSSSTSSSDL